MVIYYRDFHGYISTDLLIHPWLFSLLFPPLWNSGFVFASQSVYVVNDFLCLFFSISPPTTSAIFFPFVATF